MHEYPSDINREAYNLSREDLEGAKKRTRPPKYDLYDVFCAVLYVVQGGIQWRMLPRDYPKWQSVYYHFRVWSEKDEMGSSILDKVLQKLVKQIRNEDLRRDKTTYRMRIRQKKRAMTQGKSIRNQTPHYRRYDGIASRCSRNNC